MKYFALLFLSLFIISCQESYRPLQVMQTSGATPEEIQGSIKCVLDYYEEDYKIENGRVLVPSRLLEEDRELLYNYMRKSADSTWLANHGCQPIP